MRTLEVHEAREVLCNHPELRVSDIPDEGLLIDNAYILSANCEGEVTLFALDPNA